MGIEWMGVATRTDINVLNASISSRFDALSSRFDSRQRQLAHRQPQLAHLALPYDARFDEGVAKMSPMLAELGRRALVSDCAEAKLRVLSRTELANSTVFHLRLDGIDGGLRLAGERYGLAPPRVGPTLATAELCVMDRSTLATVRNWYVLTESAGELGAVHAGTVVTAFKPVASSGADAEWELTLAGMT
jgi:hypothetical protein